MPARSISKFLTSSNKVANALDWSKNGSLLSILVRKTSIELAVASNPSLGDPLEQLPSIPLVPGTVNNQKVLLSSLMEELSDVVEDFAVCGVVVAWPVQKEGWCGEQCGRVLHTLDQVTEQSATVVSARHPICLWGEEHLRLPDDQWGRASMYSRETTKTIHQASKEQYDGQEGGSVVLNVWKGFVQTHWPDFYEENEYNWDEASVSL